MRETFKQILAGVDIRLLMKNIGELWGCELGQTNTHQIAAAAHAAKMLGDAGVSNVETMNLPADGKTVFQDLIMPMAWRASAGRLTIKKSAIKFDDPVVADYEKHPFHLVKGSVATPAGGLTARIINEEQLRRGGDAQGCLVMINPFTQPRAKILKTVLDMGGLGLVSDNLVGRYETPDGIQWVTACTEGANWHVNANDRPFICFSVSPRIGDQLRLAADMGDLTALIESDGVREAGVLPVVTGVIPGRQNRELWLMAHLYEPMTSDNSAGVAVCVEIARILKMLADSGKIPRPEFSLRMVFASEFYGFTGFIEKMGGEMRDRAVGAINMDAMPVTVNTNGVDVAFTPPGTPCFGNYLMEKLLNDCGDDILPADKHIVAGGIYTDDASFNDATVGLPTLWLRSRNKLPRWHNSTQDMSFIDEKLLRNHTACVATWAFSVLSTDAASLPGTVKSALTPAKSHLHNEVARIKMLLSDNKFHPGNAVLRDAAGMLQHKLDAEIAQLMDFGKIAGHPAIAEAVQELKADADLSAAGLKTITPCATHPADASKSTKWFDYSAGIVPRRTGRGFPYDLAVFAGKGKTGLPSVMNAGAVTRRIFAQMDGKKSLQRLICESAWETGQTIDEAQIKKHIATMSFLSDHGYLTTEFKQKTGSSDIVAALKKLGVQAGDLIMAHSSLSSFGRIEGGADALIDALLDAVGATGTVLFPAFTRSFMAFNGVLVKEIGMPYDKDNASLVWTGGVPRAVLKRNGVVRSNHATHSVAGIGPLAKQCLSAHKLDDSPAGETSPWPKLAELRGKILYMGCGLGSSTFLHWLETAHDLPYLGEAACRVKCGNAIRMIVIPKHLPGHRDFYTPAAEQCKFFKTACGQGLEIRSVPVGVGRIQMVDAAAFNDVGMRIVKATPSILLCDNPECHFCSNARQAGL